ncbi:hypothetical protein HDE_04101 [Halotydeus destructor]|nr:hypothetical protein HDE_04101 [Halotydeus destructor]
MDDAFAKSRDLALSARGEIRRQNYAKAIDLLFQAIHLDGKSMKYCVDICLCYRKLEQFEDALEVINDAIKLDNHNHELHGEKGHILMLMNRFKESESSSKTAHHIMECDTYVKKLAKVRELALASLGFDKSTSRRYAITSESINEAVAKATNQEISYHRSTLPKMSKVKVNPELGIHENISLSDIENVSRTSQAKYVEPSGDFKETKRDAEWVPEACHTRPDNIFGCKGLFIQNLRRSVTGRLTEKYFAEFGTITDLTVRPYGSHFNSALITYSSPLAPVEAIYKYHGRLVDHLCPDGERLRMRFKSGTNQKYPRNENREWISRECKYWRTTGCDERVRMCNRLHLPMCRGIDYQPWMVTDIFY